MCTQRLVPKAHRRSGSYGQDVGAFRFDEGSLDEFDMVFLFGIERSLGISSNEAAAIARFMDAGGGVFATGGHEDPVTPEVAERLFRSALDSSSAAVDAIDVHLVSEMRSIETLRQWLGADSAKAGVE